MIAQAIEQIRNTVSTGGLDESATKQGVVLRPGSPNAVFIEVKRLGENLERHQQQL